MNILKYRSSSYRNGLIALATACGLLVITGVLIERIAHQPFSLSTFGLSIGVLICLGVLGIVLYWTIATLGLCYGLDRNGIRIWWGGSQWVIPIENIQAVIPVKRLMGDWELRQLCRRRTWLGGWTRCKPLHDGRMVVWRSNEALENSIAVLTAMRVYIISPEQPETFIQSWRERQPLGTTQNWREEEKPAHWLSSPLWNDRIVWGLMGGTLATSLALFGTMALAYPRLPEQLALHFDVLGQPDRVGQRSEILHLPVAALAMLVVDLSLGFAVYRRDRVAAYLIWAGGILLQMLTWSALYTIVTQ
ncbi:MAG: DUF1648 domain-containing protein [Anaerolineae bacterium]